MSQEPISSITPPQEGRNIIVPPLQIEKPKTHAVHHACIFLYLCAVLSESTFITEVNVKERSTILSFNADAQSQLNAENSAIQFEIAPPGANNQEITRVQQINNQRAAVRSDIQNELVTCRQTGQVEMTGASTTINCLEQQSAQFSGWLKTLNGVCDTINAMGRPQ